MWCAVVSIWLHELRDFVVAIKYNFYLGVLEKVCDLSELWGYVYECRPLGVVFGSRGWCFIVILLYYLPTLMKHGQTQIECKKGDQGSLMNID
jgi:hypothetical protein